TFLAIPFPASSPVAELQERLVITEDGLAGDNRMTEEYAVAAYEKLIARIAAIKDEGEAGGEGAEKCREAFMAALANDVNTSLAVTALYDTLKADISGKAKLELVAEYDRVLALDLIGAAKRLQEKQAKEEENAADNADPRTAYILEMIEKRKEAKKAKNYAEADAIRNQLASEGITLIDTPEGTKFKIEG
ncbi:MAG: hypothetical protein IIV03_05805, partial [Clostridia bacterium]|nr:hypothetical protein [Clostridia bacterium]